MNKLTIAAALACSLALTGCVNSLSGNTYSRSEARQVQQVQYGIAQSATPVVIEGTNTIVGPGTGAVIVALVGSNLGGGQGQTLATVLGALAVVYGIKL